MDHIDIKPDDEPEEADLTSLIHLHSSLTLTQSQALAERILESQWLADIRTSERGEAAERVWKALNSTPAQGEVSPG